MKCPTCNITLLLTEMQSVSIDYCPQCRGIWLEKGKLEKLMERSTSQGFDNGGGSFSDNRHSDRHDEHRHRDGHKRKNSLFDFFD